MSNYIIKFTKDTFEQLKGFLLQDQNERHAFLYCNLSKNKNTTIFLVKQIIIFKDNEIEFSQAHVKIDKKLINEVFKQFVNSDYQGLISCHSHPFDNQNVWFSSIDDTNDNNLFNYFFNEIKKISKHYEMLTMVFGQKTIAARGFNKTEQSFISVDKIVIMDTPIKYIIPTNSNKQKKFVNEELHNRQILAFGDLGQKILSNLKVTLVGAGGTGSILAEALVRLGIKELVIIDHDKLETTNLNRWQGGKISDVGKYKVNILRRNLKNFNENINIKVFRENVFKKNIINYIKDSDVIIGAIDSNKARYFLNRFSALYLIPFLDCSSNITVKDNKISKLTMRNVIVIPSITKCFNCEKDMYYKISDFAYDFTSKEIKEEAKRRKYINSNEDIKSPAVYPINMMSVSYLLLEFMNIFLGYKDTFTENIYINNITLNDTQKLAWEIETPHVNCINCNDYIGLGDLGHIETLFKE